MTVTWILETAVFPESGAALGDAVRAAGHDAIEWSDDWWSSGDWPRLDSHVVFHGCLENAARIQNDLPWRPGAWCDVEAFRCSSWYPDTAAWSVHKRWRILTAKELCDDPEGATQGLATDGRVFVRPDSPLKPFSGRVLRVDEIKPSALDHGFYFDDLEIPVVLAPIANVGPEWRYVVAAGEIVAGSAYLATGRHADGADAGGAPWAFAAEVASAIPPPADVYVLDVCDVDGELRLLELNPFGGADLYACNASDVVGAVSRALQ